MHRLNETDALQKSQLLARLKADRERLWEEHDGFIPVAPSAPVCSTCGGAGAYLRKRGGDYGSEPSDAVTCPDCAGQGIRDADRLIRERRAASGMEHKADVTFEASPPYPWQAEMFGAGREYAATPRSFAWLVGASTTGKTHLSYCIGNACLERSWFVLFHNVPKLLDKLRAGYRKDAEDGFDEQMDRLFRASLLILDDYGKQAETEWSGEKLFQVTSHRLERSLPTVITTNLTTDQMDGQNLRLFQHVIQAPDVLFVNFPNVRPARSAR
jgi:hypothetical protein